MRVERGITVAHLLAEPRLNAIIRLVAGQEGQDRILNHPRVQKPGLVLVGHTHGVVPTRVQILGETEITFLEGLSPKEQLERLRILFGLGLSLVVVTRGVTNGVCSSASPAATRAATGVMSRRVASSPSRRDVRVHQSVMSMG